MSKTDHLYLLSVPYPWMHYIMGLPGTVPRELLLLSFLVGNHITLITVCAALL